MKLLALESSCERASVALFLSGEMRMHWLDGHTQHSENMLLRVRHLLDEAGLSVGMLDAVAFGSGPGAFTGLRLACGIAQGLALGAGLKVIPVCSLAALAAQSPFPLILAATDARMGEIYHARYRIEEGIPIELSAPACCPPAELPRVEGQWFGMGSAFSVHEAEFAPGLLGCDPAAVPSADAVARLAARGVTGQPFPLYVRDKVALTVAERQARGNRA